jgi:hypothetical protein
LKDWSFHKRGTEVLQGILLYVGKSTTQLEPIGWSLLEIMEYPDRSARSQCKIAVLERRDVCTRFVQSGSSSRGDEDVGITAS